MRYRNDDDDVRLHPVKNLEGKSVQHDDPETDIGDPTQRGMLPDRIQRPLQRSTELHLLPGRNALVEPGRHSRIPFRRGQ